MTTLLDNYPNRIRELRKARGLTQKGIADQIGVTPVHVGHLELGRRDISMSMLRAIARFLEVSVADLLSANDNPIGSDPRSRKLLGNWAKSCDVGRRAIEQVAECMTDLSKEK